eukprot:TRINITY_DN21379_c0_g3_i1.p1 TRINITY_DN21379_c0_g3~~TRINITY_DN21379_c0_g3_i1.p1  ORF type:complete len:1143 (-),score=240.93 TRINITY_DN21379_c0_g3_i1:195-3623(-)
MAADSIGRSDSAPAASAAENVAMPCTLSSSRSSPAATAVAVLGDVDAVTASDDTPEAGPPQRRAREGLISRSTTDMSIGIGERQNSSNSIMQNIRARMMTLFQQAPRRYAVGLGANTSPSVATPRDLAAAAVAQTATECHRRVRDKSWADLGSPEEKARSSNFVVSFRAAIITSITLAVVISCACMSLPLEMFFTSVKQSSEITCLSAVSTQKRLINGLVFQDITRVSFMTILRTMGVAVERVVRNPANDAIDSLWSMQRMNQKFYPTYTGRSEKDRESISYTAWLLLDGQAQSAHSNLQEFGGMPTGQRDRIHAEWLYIAFPSGETSGAILQRNAKDVMMASRVDSPRGNNNMTMWKLDEKGNRILPPYDTFPYNAMERPYYQVQQDVARQSAKYGPFPIRRLWSRIYSFVGKRQDLGLSLTTPIAYCGNYSCFEGVLAADITLSFLNQKCRQQWRVLREMLASDPYRFGVGSANSTVFLINHVSERFPEQQGALLGVADGRAMDPAGRVLTHAEASRQEIVRTTSQALRAVFGSWTNPALIGEQLIHFRRSAMAKAVPEFINCSANEENIEANADCQAVGTISVKLDMQTRWLVVVSLPSGAFTRKAVKVATVVAEQVRDQKQHMYAMLQKSRWLGFGVALGTTLVCVALAVALASRVARPLRGLSKLMRRLGDLDFDYGRAMCASGNNGFRENGRRSWIRDVSDLQDAYWRLFRGVETFAHFVPETVVRNIVRGDERATRLNVSRRVVTIMFSDIRDFTSITEALSQCDLLFLLTRYLSVMTHIVELMDGVVAEILGDGLLVFWNTPDIIKDHAAKACAAALAQQAAVLLLNEEFSELGLPELAIRIGVHTGEVFTGNIGSEMKMKFGCMGDPMNTASRLEGLCKVYGAGILCSGDTLRALPRDERFLTRRLDLVQVKGKRKPITIHEVIARDEDGPERGNHASTVGPGCTEGGATGAGDGGGGGASVDIDVEVGQMSENTDDRGAPMMRHEDSVARQALSMSRSTLQMAERFLYEPVRWLRKPRPTVRFAPEPDDGSGARSFAAAAAEHTPAAVAAPTAEQREMVKLYEGALDAYQAARFPEAARLLDRFLQQWPNDLAAANLLERSRRYTSPDGLEVTGISAAELAAWDGCVVMVDK